MQVVNIIENFKSFQGEGPNSGRAMLILRFKYCDRVENKRTCEFCDTIIKMRITNESESKIEDIQKVIDESNCGVLISGGEPTYEKHFNDCLSLINELEYSIANIETNGYNLIELMDKTNDDKNVKFIYSPKIFNEDDLKEEIDRTSKIIKHDKVNQVYLKIVAENNEFILEYLTILKEMNLNQYTYLMPQGKNRDELLKNAPIVFDMAEEFKMNFSSREHIIYDFI